MCRWLEAHCRLAGIDYLLETDGVTAPWPITGAQRRWMYAAIAASLTATARANDPDVADGRVFSFSAEVTGRRAMCR